MIYIMIHGQKQYCPVTEEVSSVVIALHRFREIGA
jgi:hypothetical protein